jgi:hypothetical protein
MKHTLLIRLGGLAAMVSGVLYAAQGLAVWLLEPPFSLSIPYLNRASDLTRQTLVNVSDVALIVGALAAIVALHTLHREFYGMTETLVTLLALVGVTLILLSGLGDVLGPWWPSMPPIFTPPSWDLALAVVGGIGLGAVAVAARVLPWWCGVALIVGSLLFAPASLFGELFSAAVGVAWALVGSAVFRAGRRRTQQPSRVR